MSMSDPAELARRRRNLFMALALAAFVLLVFAITMAQLGASVAQRPL